ncbi:hypothetical protein PM082_013707 [Marasmius tenuissimus]|nr:hypothetical protein PM082_013707 [Marasmius tenuissimus]
MNVYGGFRSFSRCFSGEGEVCSRVVVPGALEVNSEVFEASSENFEEVYISSSQVVPSFSQRGVTPINTIEPTTSQKEAELVQTK